MDQGTIEPTVVKRLRLLEIGAYVAACLLPLAMMFLIRSATLRVPFEDEWEWAHLLYLSHLGNLHFVDLWQQHNEHRMLFPNLIMLGLASLGGWNQLRETLLSLVLVVVTQAGLFVLLRRIVAPPQLALTFLIVSMLLYTVAQMENWDWGFQTAWFLCNVCAVWVMVFLGAAGQSWIAIIAALVLASIGSFSSSQGLMIWVGGFAAILLTEKRNAPQLVVWLAGAAIVFATYFYGFVRPAAHPDPLFGIHHPFTTLRYFGAYFGAVFAGWISFLAAVIVGWSGLVALAFLIVSVIWDHRSNRLRSSRASSFVGLAVYALSVAAITTAGRVGFGEMQAEASRYMSMSIYCWIAIVALAVPYAPQIRRWLPEPIIVLWPALALTFVICYVGSARSGYDMGIGRLAEVQSAYPALIAGHGPELTAIYPVEQPVEEYIKELQLIKDGPYFE